VERSDNLMWIAMEMVQGVSLREWLKHGPLPFDRLIDFFQCVAEVVQTAHERGIVHRDLKPSNIMVIERAGRLLPKLLDFGIAKLVDESALRSRALTVVEALPLIQPIGGVIGDAQLTLTNMTLGSPPYMSPEQWLDPSAVGPASDLYSLGVMAYEALTGRLPFDAPSIAGLANLHCTEPVPPLGPAFPPALDRLFERVLAKTAAARPASAL